MAVLCKVCVDNMKRRRKGILEGSQELRIMTSLLCRALPKERKSRIQWYLEEPASFLDTTGNDESGIDDEEQSEGDSEGVSGTANNIHKQDKVYSYTHELVTLCLLYSEFKDAIKEGDGIRIMRVWKYFLLVFKVAGRKTTVLKH